MTELYGSMPLSLDSKSAPTRIQINDLDSKVPANTYNFTISVSDQSSNTVSGEVNF